MQPAHQRTPTAARLKPGMGSFLGIGVQDLAGPDPAALRDKLLAEGLSQDVCVNDLEPPAQAVLPVLARIKQVSPLSFPCAMPLADAARGASWPPRTHPTCYGHPCCLQLTPSDWSAWTQALKDGGFHTVLLSGSGATTFCLSDKSEADPREALKAAGLWNVRRARPCSRHFGRVVPYCRKELA